MPNSILFLGISLQFKDINKLNESTLKSYVCYTFMSQMK